MATELDLERDFTAPAEELYALFCDRQFVQDRLDVLDSTSREVVSHDVADNCLTLVIRQGMSRKKLPKPVRGFVRGEPAITREETWVRAGEGFSGETAVILSGPGSITGRMTLRPSNGGSRLTVHIDISVPIPMFGGEVEKTLASEITQTLNTEADFAMQCLERRTA